MSEKVYVLGYSIGEYSDRSEETICAFRSEENAKKIEKDLNEIKAWIAEVRKDFRAAFIVYKQTHNFEMGPIRPRKNSKPEWQAMSEKEWFKKIILPYQKEYQVWQDKATIINNDRAAWEAAWISDAYSHMPAHLKEARAIHVQSIWNDPNFFIVEVDLLLKRESLVTPLNF